MKLVVLAAAAMAGAPAFAQEFPAPEPGAVATPEAPKKLYVSAGVAGLRIDEDPFFFNPGWGSFQGRLGYHVTPNIAVEGEMNIAFNPYTFDDDDETYDDPDAADLNSSFAAYLVPKLPVSPTMNIYGRLGYLWAEYEYGSGPLTGLVPTGWGPGIGGGIEFDFSSNMAFYFDYTWFSLSNEDELGGVVDEYDASGSSLGAGLTIRF